MQIFRFHGRATPTRSRGVKSTRSLVGSPEMASYFAVCHGQNCRSWTQLLLVITRSLMRLQRHRCHHGSWEVLLEAHSTCHQSCWLARYRSITPSWGGLNLFSSRVACDWIAAPLLYCHVQSWFPTCNVLDVPHQRPTGYRITHNLLPRSLITHLLSSRRSS